MCLFPYESNYVLKHGGGGEGRPVKNLGSRLAKERSGSNVRVAEDFLLTSPLTCWTSRLFFHVSPSSSKGYKGEKVHAKAGLQGEYLRLRSAPQGRGANGTGRDGTRCSYPRPSNTDPLPGPSVTDPGAGAGAAPVPPRPAVAVLNGSTPQASVGNETPPRGLPPPSSGPHVYAERRSA